MTMTDSLALALGSYARRPLLSLAYRCWKTESSAPRNEAAGHR